MNSNLGELVGFKVRFAEKISKKTAVKVMTDGILLAETQSDPLLKNYDAIIIDEAHERSLNIDFLLGYLKNLITQRQDLKIIITSATIDVDKFSAHFNNAPIIQVSGRTYPVDVIYRPLKKISEALIESIEDGIVGVINELGKVDGDILVFLPGERDIHDTKKYLSDQFRDRFDVLPLFSRLPFKDQQKIFQVATQHRIILATNIAETSLTVPGIKYVIDAGLARVVRYSPNLKIDQLLIEKISKASANQRAGRCGRIAPGICIRLYDEEDYNLRPDFTDPEIIRTSLASVILRMADLNLGQVDKFPFIHPPSNRLIQDGYQLLQELGAVDKQNKILPLGKQIAMLPIDPAHARVLLEAKKENCLHEILIIISALSVSDPRERPLDKAEQADQAHQQFHDPDSGFMILLRLWSRFQLEVNKNQSKQLRQFCQKYFVSYNRMREWRELHKQLTNIVEEMSFNINQKEATYDQVHRALLAGHLSNIGQKEIDGPMYLGGRGVKFLIGPRLFRNKNFKWLMAAEIIDTGKRYAQCVAKIDVAWVEQMATHLVEYEYANPRWNSKLGRVDATQKTLLYGLIINPAKTIHYGPIDPIVSREIFIRQALVEGNFESQAPFWQHNLELIKEVEKLEHKARRQDILINDDILYQFYDEKIEKDIINLQAFESWRKKIEQENTKFLFLTKEFLMQHDAEKIDLVQFPEHIKIGSIDVNVSYHFDPNHPRDGISVTLPFSLMSQIQENKFSWLVPGMIREKVTFLIKNLPKNLRGQCGHLQNAVTEFLQKKNNTTNFNEAFTHFIREKSNSAYKLSEEELANLPEHLKVNFILIDQNDRVIDESRNLNLLKANNKEMVTEVIEDIDFGIEKTQLIFWPDYDIPETIEKEWENQMITGYPALIDRHTHVDLIVLDAKEDALKEHAKGIKRLLRLQLKDKIKVYKKNFLQSGLTTIKLTKIISPETLIENTVDITIDEIIFRYQESIRTKVEFSKLLIEANKSFVPLLNELTAALKKIAESYYQLSLAKDNFQFISKAMQIDYEEQLEILLPPYELPLFQWSRINLIDKYLTTMRIRFEKYLQRQQKDHESITQISRLKDKWIEKVIQYVERDLPIPNAFIDFQWDLQELRVSLFAQELKTTHPISIKRMNERWSKMMDL